MKRTLSALALAGLLLSGCSGGTTDIERNDESPAPMISTPIESTTPEVTDTSEPSPAGTSTPTTSTPTAPVEPSDTAPPVTRTSVRSATPSEPAPTSLGNGASTTSKPSGTWVTMDVTVTTPAEADNLTQTSAEFRAFVAGRVATPDSSGCQSELTVQAFHPAGFAAGQDFAPGCGGSQAIWGIVGGQWETIMAMQTVVDCTEMTGNNIPKGLPDIPCLDAGGDLTSW